MAVLVVAVVMRFRIRRDFSGRAGLRRGMLILVLFVVVLFVAQQRFAVGDRDLIVVGVDFREGEETVSVAAILDECGLERGLHTRHLAR